MKLVDELANLERRGVALPQNKARATLEAHEMHRMARDPRERGELGKIVRSVSVGSPVTSTSPEVARINSENAAMTKAMGSKRMASRRMGSTSLGSDAVAAIPRFYDPLEYWDLSGLPWNMADEGHRHKLHKWLRLYKATHYLVPILIDIFTRFPLVGMNLDSKDPALDKWYEQHFFEDLAYDDFFVRLGQEFWTVGEAFPLASFDENLGCWEREELLNPEDIVVENFSFLGTKQLKAKPPEHLKRLVQTKSPAKEYRLLETSFPELIPYVRRGDPFPINDVLLKQVAHFATDWDDHGTPILLRGLRTLMHEEKLMASQDAIAERLYSPLILATLGIEDLGDGAGPWLPGPEELDAVRDDMDIALSSDFRLMVHHHGLKVENVFGREQMPRLGDDFDRIERRLMQVFGVNPSLLSAGSSSQPYASSALQAEFLNQVLRTYQSDLKKHFTQRAMICAEAQEHYDYELKGGHRIPIMEEVVVVDPDTGQTVLDSDGYPVTERKNKLLVPKLDFATLDLRDEATERQFLMNLRQMGVPIPNADLMVGIDWDMEPKLELYNKQLKQQTIAQQRAKMETYQALVAEKLPVPPDLKAEVEAMLGGGPAPPQPGMGAGGGGSHGPGPGMTGPGAGGGPGAGIMMPDAPPGLGGPGGGLGPGGLGGPVPGGGPPPAGPLNPQRGTVPEVSNERRPGLSYGPTARTAGEEADWELEVPADLLDESDESARMTEEDIPLKPNQEFVGEGEKEIILERYTAGKKKRYSFLDEEAEPDTTED